MIVTNVPCKVTVQAVSVRVSRLHALGPSRQAFCDVVFNSHDQHWPQRVMPQRGLQHWPQGVTNACSTGPRESRTLAALAPGSHERLQHWLQGVTNACSTGPRGSRTFAALAPGSHERLQHWLQGVTNACSIAMGHQRGTAADSRLHQHRPAGRLRAKLQRKPTAAFPYYLQ